MNGVIPYKNNMFAVLWFGKTIIFYDKAHADNCYKQLKTGLITPDMFICED